MRKGLLMSGECKIGYIGEETKLYDSYGEPLFTGDLVALSHYDENNPDKFDDYYGVSYVCNNEFQDNGLEKKKFVMGVASEHKEYEDGFGESIIHQNHKKWRLRKVKGYENLVDGEVWGSVMVVFVE